MADRDDDFQRTIDLLWGVRSEPRRGPKPSLSPERIAQAVTAIADADGLDAVSMQRVALECGVTTMALYRYVPGKAELIALALDIGIGHAPALEGIAGGWRGQIEEWARQLWQVFMRSPWSLEATAPVRPMGPNELAWFEVAVSALSATNLPANEVVQAVTTVLLLVRGLAPYATRGTTARQPGFTGSWSTIVSGLVSAHGADYPALASAQAAGAFSVTGGDDPGFGLRLVLDGISARIAELTSANASGRRGD